MSDTEPKAKTYTVVNAYWSRGRYHPAGSQVTPLPGEVAYLARAGHIDAPEATGRPKPKPAQKPDPKPAKKDT